MPDTPAHLFTTCQVGAEGALKAELERDGLLVTLQAAIAQAEADDA